MIRQPAVSGSFYPSLPATLSTLVDTLLVSKTQSRKAKAIIVPHAGYVYSGAVAGEVFASTDIPKQVLLLGPNHHGFGPAIAVSGVDSWATPLGHVPLDGELREQLLRSITDLKINDSAHEHEHSLEVMLPFLLRRQPDLSIVPVALGHLGLESCLALGSALATVLNDYEQDVLLLASSDMNHFSSAEITGKLDSLAIDAMEAYDPVQLYHVVREKNISMCGVLPVIVVMQAAREMGASSCRIVNYSHSGQVNGDNSSVVGYAGLTIQ
jgi:MEMO1 family protein